MVSCVWVKNIIEEKEYLKNNYFGEF